MERKGAVAFKGMPLTLCGKELKVGEHCPDFEVVNADLQLVRFSHFKGKPALILTVPSLDTPLCDMQTRRFNEEAAKFGDHIAFLTLSMDLPFAQKRWCGSAGIASLQVLSDHRKADFGEKCGLLIQELRLLARASLLVDRQGVVRHLHLCKDITEPLPYEQILQETKALLSAR